MQKEELKRVIKNKDFWGSGISILCAIHCALIPLLLSVGSFHTANWLDSIWLEISVVLLASLFIFQCMLIPYLKDEHDGKSLWVSLLGLALVILHFFHIPFSHVIVVIGGLLIAIGHIMNLNRHFSFFK